MAIDFKWFSQFPRQPTNAQETAIDFLLHTNHGVLADPTGIGKTYCSLAAYAYYARGKTPRPKLLFLAKKSSAFKMADEVRQALGIDALVISGDEKVSQREALTKLWSPERPVLITTYPRLLLDWQMLIQLANPEADCLVADECHVAKTTYPSPSQTHLAVQRLQAKFRVIWGLTATPFSNSPLETYGILSALDPRYLGDLYAFLDRYCQWRVEERPQPRIIVKAIKDPAYYSQVFRRLMSREDSGEMPNVHFYPVQLELKPEQKGPYFKAQKVFEYLKNEGKNVGTREILTLEKIASAPQTVGVDCLSPKADWLVKFLAEHPQRKVVVFTTFVDILHWYVDFLRNQGHQVVYVTGEVNDAQERYDVVKDFNTNPNTRVILINRAGSDSIDLDGAADLVFVGLPFSAIDNTQTMGRIRRLSSKFDDVRVHLLLCGQIDAIKAGVLRKKMRMESQTRDYSDLTFKFLDERKAAREAKTTS